MPLTALVDRGAVVDATDCSADAWAGVHRVRPRALLSCRSCGSRMQAKVSSRGLRFFAHDREASDCPAAGETPEHRWLKRRLAEAVRTAGWLAVVEAQPAAGDVGGWRADVLALGPEGRRVALEAQLAPMTPAVGEDRMATYRSDGIATVWFTTKGSSWLYRIPGVQLTDGTENPDGENGGEMLVRRGCARLRDGDPAHGWEPAVGVEMTRLVAGILAGRVMACTLPFLSETVQAGSQERYYAHHDAVVLAGTGQIERSNSYLAQLEAERARAAEARRAREAEAERPCHVVGRAGTAGQAHRGAVRSPAPAHPWRDQRRPGGGAIN